MTHRNRITLICLNVVLIALGLYFGVPSLRSSIPPSKRSAKETRALVERTSDTEKLRAIIMADDESIRADRQLASLLRKAAIATSAAAVAVGVACIVFLNLGTKKQETSAMKPFYHLTSPSDECYCGSGRLYRGCCLHLDIGGFIGAVALVTVAFLLPPGNWVMRVVWAIGGLVLWFGMFQQIRRWQAERRGRATQQYRAGL